MPGLLAAAVPAGHAASLLLGTLFVTPWPIPPASRLWWFLPLALAVALVYRLTRAQEGERVLVPTARIFVNIVVGMWAIAIAVYVVHELVLRSY